MQIVEIKALSSGAHDNRTYHGTLPDGWAIIPDGMETPNFPFGELEAIEVDGIMTVIKWTAGKRPEPIQPTPVEEREEAYRTLPIVEWEDKLLTVDQANKIYYNYFVEDSYNALLIKENIIIAKQTIRELYPN